MNRFTTESPIPGTPAWDVRPTPASASGEPALGLGPGGLRGGPGVVGDPAGLVSCELGAPGTDRAQRREIAVQHPDRPSLDEHATESRGLDGPGDHQQA